MGGHPYNVLTPFKWEIKVTLITKNIHFESFGPVKRLVKKLLVNPFANFAPAGLLKKLLEMGDSDLAKANWKDPGGWKSMVISYDGNPEKLADKILVNAGTIPTALRNRRRLGAHAIASLIDESDHHPAHILCVGAGPGRIIMDAMLLAKNDSFATLVDLTDEPFAHGLARAKAEGLADRVRFIQADVRDGIEAVLDRKPDITKMIGICEYLTDAQISEIAYALAKVMPAGSSIVFNSISKSHGTDRFFRRVFGLNIIHRSPKQLQDLLEPAGFTDFVSHREPLGVYHIIIGRRVE